MTEASSDQPKRASKRGVSRRVLVALTAILLGGVVAFAWFRRDPGANLAIPVEEAKYLQDAEHLGGFVLGDLAFPKIAEALKAGDEAALKEFFAPDFKGNVFADPEGKVREYPFAKFQSWKDGDEIEPLDRDQFVNLLLDLKNEFIKLDMAKLKVMQMSPVTYRELDGPWKGTMKLILAGRNNEGRVAHRVINFHCNISGISDETPDLREWMTGAEMYSSKLRTSDNHLMRDMTAETGIRTRNLRDNWNVPLSEPRPFLTGGMYACDFNRDGLNDLLLTDLDGLALYQGTTDGTFTDVTQAVGLPRLRSLGAVFAAFDGDGYEDLLVGQLLFRNDAGKQFVPLTKEEHNLKLPADATNFSVVDYDRDGKVDLYVVGLLNPNHDEQRWIGKTNHQYNLLLRNLGDWKFEDVTESTGTGGSGSATFAAVWYDANGDNWPDVMTACEFGTNDYYINDGKGGFTVGELPGGYGGFSMGITVSDINNDGFGDPYIANMYSKAGARIVGNLKKGIYDDETDALMRDFVVGNELFRNRGDGTYDRIGVSAGINDVGWTYGVGFVDFNGDGLPDVFSPAGFQSVSPHKPDG